MGTQPTDTARAEQVLAGLAGQLRQTIDAVAAGVDSTDNRRTGDDRTTCSDGYEDWPAQQIYGRSLLANQKDSRPAAEAVLAKLASQGWTINRGGPGNGVDSSESVAVKDGASITVSAGVSDNGGMVLLGGTACVAADGTVDERNPS